MSSPIPEGIIPASDPAPQTSNEKLFFEDSEEEDADHSRSFATQVKAEAEDPDWKMDDSRSEDSDLEIVTPPSSSRKAKRSDGGGTRDKGEAGPSRGSSTKSAGSKKRKLQVRSDNEEMVEDQEQGKMALLLIICLEVVDNLKSSSEFKLNVSPFNILFSWTSSYRPLDCSP